MKKSHREIEFESPPNKKSKQDSKMEQILNNPGLQHITERIFCNLEFKDLMSCQLMNNSCNQILKNSMFWLKIWQLKKGLSEENQKCWINAIQNAQKWPQKEFYIQSYIKQVIRIGHFVDVPCYIDNKTLKRFSKRSSFIQALKKKDAGILQMLAATTKNFNSRSYSQSFFIRKLCGLTPIEIAANAGDTDIVKVLAPIIKWDCTHFHPITRAAIRGHADIANFLAPLTKYPNALDKYRGLTPIQTAIELAAEKGHDEIVKFLRPYIEDKKLLFQ